MIQAGTITQQIEQCIDALKDGSLTEEHLQAILQQLHGQPSGHQDVLYIQAQNTGITGSVLGISLVENGIVIDMPDNPAEWPYKTVAEAVQDGWRIVQFPSPVMDDERTYGLGCEFILEKWSL